MTNLPDLPEPPGNLPAGNLTTTTLPEFPDLSVGGSGTGRSVAAPGTTKTTTTSRTTGAPRVTPLRQARNDLARIHAHGHHELAAHATAALERLTTWNTHGYPTAGTSGKGGDHADPTGSAAARHDEIGVWLTATIGAIHQIATGLDELDRSAAWSRPLTPRQVLATLAGQRPVGGCSQCPTVVSGARNDRIKSGLCPACYQRKYRQGVTHPDQSHDQGILA